MLIRICFSVCIVFFSSCTTGQRSDGNPLPSRQDNTTVRTRGGIKTFTIIDQDGKELSHPAFVIPEMKIDIRSTLMKIGQGKLADNQIRLFVFPVHGDPTITTIFENGQSNVGTIITLKGDTFSGRYFHDNSLVLPYPFQELLNDQFEYTENCGNDEEYYFLEIRKFGKYRNFFFYRPNERDELWDILQRIYEITNQRSGLLGCPPPVDPAWESIRSSQ